MVATAFGAHGFAKYQAEARELRMRDYSSPEKWVEPKYASRNDMEAVSLLRTCTEEVGREISASAGLSFWRLGTLVPPAQSVCWLRGGMIGPVGVVPVLIPLQSLRSSFH